MKTAIASLVCFLPACHVVSETSIDVSVAGLASFSVNVTAPAVWVGDPTGTSGGATGGPYAPGGTIIIEVSDRLGHRQSAVGIWKEVKGASTPTWSMAVDATTSQQSITYVCAISGTATKPEGYTQCFEPLPH